MANNNEFENEQTESLGNNVNYRQGFSTAIASSRPAKIVTPLNFNRRFNASSAIKRNDRRVKEELPPDTNEKISNEELPKDNIGDKIKEKAVEVASKKLPPGLQGIGKNAMNNLLSGGNSGKVDQMLFKTQKMKLYLIAAGVFFGLFFVLAIIFTVSTTGGTEAAGAGFNEVSEYELEESDDDVIDDETGDIIEEGEEDAGLTQ